MENSYCGSTEYPTSRLSPYTNLDIAKQEIRLLEITSVDPFLTVKLHTVSLQDRPSFSALSYVWGSQDKPERITVNQTSVPVTRNLEAALHDVHYQWLQDASSRAVSTRRLWVDAICINQDDDEEKYHQIPFMTGIYSGAEQVFSWLGRDPEPESPGSLEKAFNVLRSISQELTMLPHQKNAIVTEDGECEHEFRWMRKNSDIMDCYELSSGISPWNSLSVLMVQPYWTRVWIFQEMFLAQNVLIFIIGRRSLSYEMMRRAWDWLKFVVASPENRPPFMSGVLWVALKLSVDTEFRPFRKIDDVQKVHLHMTQLSRDLKNERQLRSLQIEYHSILLSTLMADGFQATDPRDYVYGLLGISELRMGQERFPALEILKLWQECDEEYQSVRSQHTWVLMDLWFLAFAFADSVVKELSMKVSRGKFRWAPSFHPSLYAKSSYGFYPSSRADRMPAFCGIFDGRFTRWGINKADHLECWGVAIDQVGECGPEAEDVTEELVLWVVEQLVAHPFYWTEGARQYSVIPMQRALLNNEDPSSLFESCGYDVTQLVGLLICMSRDCEQICIRTRTLFQDLCMHDHEPDLSRIFSAVAEYLHTPSYLHYPPHSHYHQYQGTSLVLRVNFRDQVEGHSKVTWESALQKAWGPRIGVTKKTHFGRFPRHIEENDEVWLLKGYDRPVILRKVEEHYIFVGSAYIVEPLRGRTQIEIDELKSKISRVEIF